MSPETKGQLGNAERRLSKAESPLALVAELLAEIERRELDLSATEADLARALARESA